MEAIGKQMNALEWNFLHTAEISAAAAAIICRMNKTGNASEIDEKNLSTNTRTYWKSVMNWTRKTETESRNKRTSGSSWKKKYVRNIFWWHLNRALVFFTVSVRLIDRFARHTVSFVLRRSTRKCTHNRVRFFARFKLTWIWAPLSSWESEKLAVKQIVSIWWCGVVWCRDTVLHNFN